MFKKYWWLLLLIIIAIIFGLSFCQEDDPEPVTTPVLPALEPQAQVSGVEGPGGYSHIYANSHSNQHPNCHANFHA